ncbi:peptidoglycan-recognition protein LB-like [Trichoplusia ni]|uniref:Peptidoglycan-recognition protein n=1 Tax=Trichoplusia ni TaxID=7111 RepID=A0A7E5WJA2_TRINI|nr:peptidoglycan-recognition protein LB-like [Trichoplusia ni]XP_026740217.1 peptidoglycan-recognition protein LB-like [Trichoplusia ni]XP_026740219.1 peptidoglycan-recognition protein LB-like [Trichoplusia ni]
MASLFAIVILCLAASAASQPTRQVTTNFTYPFNFVSREQWGARPPASTYSQLSSPVPYVVVHHTYIPPACATTDVCKRYMRSMQTTHQVTNGWQDIGYNFAVGGDGSVYEGRGWEAVGAHAVGYNVQSIGVVMIGDFVSNLPPANMLQTLKDFIAAGVNLGYISPNYRLIGHRQVSATECPGKALYNEISTWPHFVQNL